MNPSIKYDEGKARWVPETRELLHYADWGVMYPSGAYLITEDAYRDPERRQRIARTLGVYMTLLSDLPQLVDPVSGYTVAKSCIKARSLLYDPEREMYLDVAGGSYRVPFRGVMYVHPEAQPYARTSIGYLHFDRKLAKRNKGFTKQILAKATMIGAATLFEEMQAKNSAIIRHREAHRSRIMLAMEAVQFEHLEELAARHLYAMLTLNAQELPRLNYVGCKTPYLIEKGGR